MEYYAHSLEDASIRDWQRLKDHLEQTANKAATNASKFAMQDLAFVAGMLHDIGKYSVRFQRKLRGENSSVDHSSAGAQLCVELYPESIWKILSYCITGHHGGLLDYGNAASQTSAVFQRISKQLCDFSAYKGEINPKSWPPLDQRQSIRPLPNKVGFSVAFLVKMIHSSLVDADFLDTEQFYEGQSRQRNSLDFAVALSRLIEHLNPYRSLPDDCSDMAVHRQYILKRCLETAHRSQGMYTLTVPTGGGKTFSSLAFALQHAIEYKLDRIIFVLPYTTIIEQNAQVVRDIVGDDSILEHHSNFEWSRVNPSMDEQNQDLTVKLRHATENWDMPVIFTTNVQFFESIYGNSTSKCRKLHNLSKSVIILDEAQMLPVPYLEPCLLALCELVQNYSSTVLLCTATQPYLSDVMQRMLKSTNQGPNITELMNGTTKLYEQFKRVEIIRKGEIDDVELSEELRSLKRVLCIVNTRRHAKELYAMLEGERNVYHLSTLMCPLHRKRVICDIKGHLNRQTVDVEPVKVISTQLIEAGVDIDFPVVYRSLAGLDSIIQSAGRCNREGLRKTGEVFLFESTSEYAKVRGYLARTAVYAGEILRKHTDPLSLQAIEDYFRLLYFSEGLDKYEIFQDCFSDNRTLEFNFATAASRFKMIPDNMYSIVIPYDDVAAVLIEGAKHAKYVPLEYRRRLQPYTVSIYEYEFRRLLQFGSIGSVDESLFYLTNTHLYHEQTGLDVTSEPNGEAIFTQ